MTDTWLHIPLLPRRMLTWRSPDRGTWHVQFSHSPVGSGVLAAQGVLLAVANVFDILRDVGISQLVARIPDALMILGGLAVLTVLTWRVTHRPE